MIDAISTYMNGCELDQVSVLDFDAYEDTDLNWRVRRVMARDRGLWRGPAGRLQLRGDADRSFGKAPAHRDLARHDHLPGRAIVTVSTNLIAQQAIRFHPALPGKSMRPPVCRSALPTR